jgi:hypothetical protein
MRSALSSVVGGVPDGTVGVGAVPAVPAGERSAAGIAPIAFKGLPGGAVTAVDGPAPLPAAVVVVFEAEFDGEELQAASPRAPPTTRALTSAPERREREGRGMAPDGSRSPLRDRCRTAKPPMT